MFENSTVLITGGTGSWGNELTRQLLKSKLEKIVIFSRGELAQVEMQRRFNNHRLDFIIGDVRDLESLTYACRGVDFIFHLAALKHVPVCERLPQEAVKTNIGGTVNVVKAAIANDVKKVIDVSTDKAVDPLNLYGMTKAVGERLIIQANSMASTTKFACVRGGNVIGSNGSVIPFFIEQIKQRNCVSMTSPEMTRYFITLEQAIGLVLKAAHISIGGETLVMKMPSYRLIDIAKCLIELYGDENTSILDIGIRPGEKIHEVLVSKNEARLTHHCGQDYYVILPMLHASEITPHYEHMPAFDLTEYSSNSAVSNKDAAMNAIIESGFGP